MSTKIYITSLGTISGIGNGKEETLSALLNRYSGVDTIKNLATKHTDLVSTEVKYSDEELKKMLHIEDHRIITRVSLLGAMAAREAYQHANFQNAKPLGLRIGFLNGTTVGGMEKSEAYYKDFIDPEGNQYTPYISAHDCGTCTEVIADYLDHFDYVSTTSTACSSALNAIILASNLIQAGVIDCAIAGATECLSKFHLNGFNTLMILDKKQCRPFDADRAGLNLGEGAAYLVLESEESVLRRGSKPIALLSGWGNACDAYHQTASSPEGTGAVLAMQKALAMSNLSPKDIDYINAHGTGTPNNDESEGAALMTIFGEHVPPMSSTKSNTGHTTSAAGAVESVICLLAMQHRFLPPNLLFKKKIEKLNFLPVKEVVRNVNLQHILNNSFGFGGNSSSVIFSKCNEL